jgi:hypothetical protein
VIKSKEEGGHVERMMDMGNAYKFWLEVLKGRDYKEDLGVDGRIILKSWGNGVLGVWIGFIWLRF